MSCIVLTDRREKFHSISTRDDNTYRERLSVLLDRDGDNGGIAMAMVSGLSGNEIYCMALKNYAPGEIVVGNSVNSHGLSGSLGAGFGNMLGGEIAQVTQAIHEGRACRLRSHGDEGGRAHGASGVAGVAERTALLQRQHRISVRRLLRGTRPGGEPLLHQRRRRAGALLPHRRGLCAARSTCSATSPIPWASAAASWVAQDAGARRNHASSATCSTRPAMPRSPASSPRPRQARANAVVGIRTTVQPWAGHA